MSLEVEKKLQMRSEKNKQHLSSLHRREAQSLRKRGKGNMFWMFLFPFTFSYFCRSALLPPLISSFPPNFCSSSSSNSSSKSETSDVASNTFTTSFSRAPTTSDSIRLKCREMLASALQTGGITQHCTPSHVVWLRFAGLFMLAMFDHFQRIILPLVLIVRSSAHRLKNISFTFSLYLKLSSRDSFVMYLSIFGNSVMAFF